MDYDLPKNTQRPLSQIHGSPKNAEQAIEMEENEEEEEVMMTDVVEKKRSKKKKKKKKKEMRKKKKEMRKNNKEEVEKKEEEEEEEEEKRKKEDEEEEEEEKKQFLFCNQLYKDILDDNWEKAKSAFDKDPCAITRPLNFCNDIPLHIALVAVNSEQSITKLVGLMSKSDLEIPGECKLTALHYAAIVNNIKAAIILVDKNPSLTKFRTSNKETPLHLAAEYQHKEIVRLLLPVTRHEYPDAFARKSGALLLNYLIMSEFYDIAIELLEWYPDLAIQKDTDGDTPLDQLAGQTNSFFSENQLNFFQRLLYKCICVEKVNVHHGGDVENPAAEPEPKQRKLKFLQDVHNTKLKHVRALQFTKTLCAETAKLITLKKGKLFTGPILKAARLGIHELVWEILEANPDAIQGLDEHGHHIFHLAVLNRKEKVYNLAHQIKFQKHFMLSLVANRRNNILHLAGRLGPLDRVSGAALQMQRELQWFEEVKKDVPPSYILEKNKSGETPWEVFTKEHKDLVKEGEKWMTSTATSCTVVAALVITVAFAAAFTLPGGNDSEGFPIFLKDSSFMIFAVSNALALLASSTSLLMFLGILTSRYSEKDFLTALPKKFCIGLVTLFLSIAFMLAAFGSTIHIVLVRRLSWVAAPISVLACVPLTLFVFLQFPLLIKMVSSTFRPRIFGRRSKAIKCGFTCRRGKEINCGFPCRRSKEI